MSIGKVKKIYYILGVPYHVYDRVKYFTDDPIFALKYSCPHEYDFIDDIKYGEEESKYHIIPVSLILL